MMTAVTCQSVSVHLQVDADSSGANPISNLFMTERIPGSIKGFIPDLKRHNTHHGTTKEKLHQSTPTSPVSYVCAIRIQVRYDMNWGR
jgi:hypothetical protein